jgi:hypothetical protein
MCANNSYRLIVIFVMDISYSRFQFTCAEVYQLLTLKPQILILADESVEDSIVQSDSRSLATLLLIRDVQVSNRKPDCNL